MLRASTLVSKKLINNTSKVVLNTSSCALPKRFFSSQLIEKERGDENKYFRDLEAKKINDMQANMKHILSLDEDDDRKEQLLELLAAPQVEEEKGFLSKTGLNDWKYALPLGILAGIPTITNEVLMINEEFTLATMFMIFCATMYQNVGGMVAKSLDEYRESVYQQLKKVDETMLVEIQETIKSDQKLLTLVEDLKEIDVLVDDMTKMKAESLNYAEEHKYRDSIIKKLDSLVALEESITSAVKTRMVNKVKTDVLNEFANDKKSKENALNQAIAVLSAGANAKRGKDIVGESFAVALKTYRDTYAKQPAGSDEIIVNLEKEMLAIATAPIIEGTGGNVYITAPVTSAASVKK